MPFVTKVTVLQFLLTPLTMGLTLTYLALSRFEPSPLGAAVVVAWLLGGRAVRGISHLARRPGDLFILPLYALVVIFVALPVKLYAFVTMNKQGWLTRTADTVGGEGQTARTLVARGAPA